MTKPTLAELANMLTPKPSEMGFVDKDHLEYRSFSPMPIEQWDWMVSVLESFELIVITCSTITRGGRQYAGGQLFAHPDGLKTMDSAAARASEARARQETE